jgi:acetylornithine/succinyldiaminopimelate/putrescine aminotransferase
MNDFLLANYERYPLTVDRGFGSWLYDTAGKPYLDMVSGLGACAFGHCHPRLTAVLAKQAGQCVHTSNLVSHRYQAELAERLCRISGLDRVFLSNSGTEAMETALKAVRARASRKCRVVALRGSFHGRTLGALAVTGQADLRDRFGPFGMEVVFVQPNDRLALEGALAAGADSLVLEPVMGEGGIHPLDVSYLQRARELTERAGAWLIADEIQCGLGRTGKYFAFQWAGIRPDIVVTAKPLGGGLPLAATLFSEEAAQFLPQHSHGSTFGGGPLACRVALEFLAMLDDALPDICQTAERFRELLDGLRPRHSGVKEIRSKGLMFGIQLVGPGRPLVDAALQRGLLINCTQQTVLRLLPPFNVQVEEMKEVVRILDEVLLAPTWALAGRPLPTPDQRSSLSL